MNSTKAQSSILEVALLAAAINQQDPKRIIAAASNLSISRFLSHCLSENNRATISADR